jgi:nucleoid DNA-binding protein
MEKVFDTLPEHIQVHLHEIMCSSGLPDNEESLEAISKNWMDKKNLFLGQIKSLDMVETDIFTADDPRGALALTYSGSLISLGPPRDGYRWMEYYSIKLRADVPEIMKTPDAMIKADTGTDKIIEFEAGPIKSTSALFKIAVCRDGVGPEEQETRIHEAVLFLTNGFVKINMSLTINKDLENVQFTTKSIIQQVAARNDITQKDARKIIDDYLIILESGMLLGERVPLGRLGRLYLKMQPARKARIGKNFITGEDVTIKARPETPAPRMSFSNRLKERAAVVELALNNREDGRTDNNDDDF